MSANRPFAHSESPFRKASERSQPPAVELSSTPCCGLILSAPILLHDPLVFVVETFGFLRFWYIVVLLHL